MSNSSINTTNPIGINSGGTFSNAQTQYGVAYYSGTQVITTSAGPSSDVLRSNGAGLAPTFQAAPGSAGGWTLISTQTASSNVVVFTGLTNAYPTYVVLFDSVVCDPVHDNIYLLFQLSVNNGSTWITVGGGQSVLSAGGLNGTGSIVGVTNNITAGTFHLTPMNGIMWFYNISSGVPSTGSYMMARNTYRKSGGAFGGFVMGESQFILGSSSAGQINAIQFYVGGGVTNVISSGTFSLYGISR